MLYQDYLREKEKYDNAFERYKCLIDEQSRLFNKTLPGGISYEKDKVESSPNSDMMDNYLIEKEKRELDSRINNIQAVVKERRHILDICEKELRRSKEICDIVFVLKVIDKKRTEEIAEVIGYSKNGVYKIQRKLKTYENRPVII